VPARLAVLILRFGEHEGVTRPTATA
jgi:hypothetical protein